MIKPEGSWILRDDETEDCITSCFTDRLRFNLTGRHMLKMDKIEMNGETPCLKESDII